MARQAWKKVGEAAFRRHFASGAELKESALHSFHLEKGAVMGPYLGCWSMPLHYRDASVADSVVHARQRGGLFDNSHLLGVSFKGRDAPKFLEKILFADVSAGLANGTCTISAFTNALGGIIDDAVVTRITANHVYLTLNGCRRDKILAHVEDHAGPFKKAGGDVNWHVHDERTIMNLAGPLAATTLQRLVKEDLSKMYCSDFKILNIDAASCFVTRIGNTGEDGFEISIPSENAVDVVKAILEKGEGRIMLSGVEARDILRLEAGLALYEDDPEELKLTPVECGIGWSITQRRREERTFLGAEHVIQDLLIGAVRHRAGVFISDEMPLSIGKNCEILNEKDEPVGFTTGGGYSPCLKTNIAAGFVRIGNHKLNMPLKVVVQGKARDAVVKRMPFLHTKFYRLSGVVPLQSIGFPGYMRVNFPSKK